MVSLGKSLIGFSAALAALGFCSVAQASEPSAEEIDPVFVFNKTCYAQVPNLQAIRNMALELAWKPLAKEDLSQFTVAKNPDALEGWDMQVGERVYRLGVVQSAPSTAMTKNFPDFSDGTATSCTLVLDGNDDAEEISARMQILAGKEPASRDVTEGALKTTTWAGGNADFKVFLFSKVNDTGKGGLLNVTILAK